ncbi:hypothetical protein P4B35_23565, partial [Pontiellaceae bacterium B12227]|nr:hypothetical protein [Pontiellaceae bacterium B12227]
MQQIDLKELEQFIADRNLVAEKYRSYYLGWVRRFLLAEFTVDELSDRDRIACFTDQLTRDPSVEEWQVRQATEAVTLYLNVYLPEANGERPALETLAAAERPADVPQEAVKAGMKMRELLRLRHYAYRTEQTYLEWV